MEFNYAINLLQVITHQNTSSLIAVYIIIEVSNTPSMAVITNADSTNPFSSLAVSSVAVTTNGPFPRRHYHRGLFHRKLYHHGPYHRDLFHHGLFHRILYHHGFFHRGHYHRGHYHRGLSHRGHYHRGLSIVVYSIAVYSIAVFSIAV